MTFDMIFSFSFLKKLSGLDMFWLRMCTPAAGNSFREATHTITHHRDSSSTYPVEEGRSLRINRTIVSVSIR